MRDRKGRFVKGHRSSPKTEFKKGQHWREPKPFWNKDYLVREYLEKVKSAEEIGGENGVTGEAILYWLKRHGISRRNTSQVRAVKKWTVEGEANGMYGRTRESNPNWKGGISPERSAFYSTQEWKIAAKAVRKRDQVTCRCCGKEAGRKRREFCIHHIVPFRIRRFRACIGNLVLLCRDCHCWVHSRENKRKIFIGRRIRRGGKRVWVYRKSYLDRKGGKNEKGEEDRQ